MEVIVLPTVRQMVKGRGEYYFTPELRDIGHDVPVFYSKQINSILMDKQLRKDDPRAVLRAAYLAGALRLSNCVDALIDAMDVAWPVVAVDENIPHEIKRAPLWALGRIGKASIPPLLKVASDPKATVQQLSAAGYVLRDVEGELAGVVVQFFIENSDKPEQTRRMLNRKAFTKQWKWYVEEAAKRRRAKSGKEDR